MTKRRRWTEKELNKLAKLFNDHTAAEIGTILGRTTFSVRRGVTVLKKRGVLKNKKPLWSAKEERFLREQLKFTTAKEIAKKLHGRTVLGIYDFMRRSGIPRHNPEKLKKNIKFANVHEFRKFYKVETWQTEEAVRMICNGSDQESIEYESELTPEQIKILRSVVKKKTMY